MPRVEMKEEVEVTELEDTKVEASDTTEQPSVKEDIEEELEIIDVEELKDEVSEALVEDSIEDANLVELGPSDSELSRVSTEQCQENSQVLTSLVSLCGDAETEISNYNWNVIVEENSNGTPLLYVSSDEEEACVVLPEEDPLHIDSDVTEDVILLSHVGNSGPELLESPSVQSSTGKKRRRRGTAGNRGRGGAQQRKGQASRLRAPKRVTHVREKIVDELTTSSSDGRGVTCVVCKAVCDSKKHLASHMHNHIGEKLYCCGVCGAKFLNMENLDKHMPEHYTEPNVTGSLSCRTCGFKLSEPNELEVHRRRNSSFVHRCFICFNDFHSHCELRMHFKRHNSGPYKCSVCNAPYKSVRNILKHMKVRHDVCIGEKLCSNESDTTKL